ncbi:hypothetical protein AB7W30_18955 [Providencia manganoxydans]|uniref:Uncharacterized protein n=1 Tax=Providencia rettgeri TaxID=587 RepID=A0A264VM46_PRORE|nr:hypothetical protein [Providencia rettgeri]OZS72426.1 hypothetical protein CHI95_21830 [Providencia rettgeri]
MKLNPNKNISSEAVTLTKAINMLLSESYEHKLKFLADKKISCEDWLKSELLFLMTEMKLSIWDRPRISKKPCRFADIGFTAADESLCDNYNFIEIKIWQYGTQNKHAKSTALDIKKLRDCDYKREHFLLIFTMLESAKSHEDIAAKWQEYRKKIENILEDEKYTGEIIIDNPLCFGGPFGVMLFSIKP